MKVSIIIPVYNGSNYLEEAIKSAINQDYNNIEVIVVNDGSNDDGLTRVIAMKYIDKIIYLEKNNGGVASALNFGIMHMTGDFFSWLSHDDLFHKSKISKQIDFILRYKINFENNLIFSNYYLIDKESLIINKSNLNPYTSIKFKVWLACYSELNGCTLLIHKSIFNRIGYFDELLKHTQDYKLWFKMALNNNFVFFPDHLVYSRQHEKQDSRAYSSEAFKEILKLKQFYIRNMPLSDIKENKHELFKLYFLQKYYKATLMILIRILLNK